MIYTCKTIKINKFPDVNTHNINVWFPFMRNTYVYIQFGKDRKLREQAFISLIY